MVICSSALILDSDCTASVSNFLPDLPKREREHSVGIGLYVRGINAVYVQLERCAGVPIMSFDVA